MQIFRYFGTGIASTWHVVESKVPLCQTPFDTQKRIRQGLLSTPETWIVRYCGTAGLLALGGWAWAANRISREIAETVQIKT